MATTKTVATNSTHTVGAGTLITHAPVVSPGMGGAYSLHDCPSIGAAEVFNMIWPINFASSDGKKFNYGLTVVHRNPADTGTVSVTVA